MRSERVSSDRFGIAGKSWLGCWCLLTVMCSVTLAGDRRHRPTTLVAQDFFEGKELFEKSWMPGKPSSLGGDGLGPVYNETSCVGCHNQGGTGGGGEKARDVLMLTVVAGSDQSLPGATVFQGELEDLHPGFRNRASIVLHRHATDPKMQKRLEQVESFTVVQTRDDIKVLRRGSRNTPALFGAGLIDAIPDRILREAEKHFFLEFPGNQGTGERAARRPARPVRLERSNVASRRFRPGRLL